MLLAPPNVVQIDHVIGGRVYHFLLLTSGNCQQSSGQPVKVSTIGHDLIDTMTRGFYALHDAELYVEQQLARGKDGSRDHRLARAVVERQSGDGASDAKDRLR